MQSAAAGFVVIGLAVAAAVAPNIADKNVNNRIDFQRQVRPLLSDRCFSCHGPDEAARKENLRLDLYTSATEPRKHGAAIVPGDARGSAMIRKIYNSDPDEVMPPRDSGRKPLSPEEKEILKKWIEQGAKYETFWSFTKPTATTPPEITDRNFSGNEIDRFVFDKIIKEGLSPAAPADRATIARRVAFDLTGIPAPAEELELYLSDGSPDAYEKFVDRLLASPRFGERMAADWLDLARYADTYGYQADVYRPVWPYRDWVIDAFNINLPYDQFITYQIAGDLLENATREQKLATAFQRLHRQTNEGGSTEEEFRVEYVADRVHTFGTAFLGLTFECARCHDHKFDPITQQDYYNLFSFFGNIDENGLYSHFTDATPTPALSLTTPEQETRINNAKLNIMERERELSAASLEALKRKNENAAEDILMKPEHFNKITAALGVESWYHLDEIADGKLKNEISGGKPGIVNDSPVLADGVVGKSLQFSGDNNAQFPGAGEWNYTDPFTISFWMKTPDRRERAVIVKRSRAWHDAGSQGYQILIEDGKLTFALIHFWPGEAICIKTLEDIPPGEWVHVAAVNSGSGGAFGLNLYLNGERAKCSIVRDHLTRSITGGDPGPLTLGERFRDVGFKNGSIDELITIGRCVSENEAKVLYKISGGNGRYGSTVNISANDVVLENAIKEYRAALVAARRKLASELDAVPRIMCMEGSNTPRNVFVLNRGRYDQPDSKRPAEPRVPAFLGEMDAKLPKNRLGLARWLTDAKNPLAARVFVNRLWAICFGRGIVATVENFGSQGTPPSHPELLDWLAVEFVKSGWNTKGMLKKMVTSATYRRSSRGAKENYEKDPENHSLSRGTSRRLTSEMLRDQMLAISGLLVNKIGGPSVKPYQPPGLWEIGWGGEYKTDAGEGRHRRSLYTYWRRTVPPPNMILFDSAKRDVCVARRQSTNTPLQSLILLNDPQFVEGAGALARVALNRKFTKDGEKVNYLFAAAAGRAPSPREAEALVQLLHSERDVYIKNPSESAEFVQSAQAEGIADAARAEWAALASVSLTILSSDAATMIY